MRVALVYDRLNKIGGAEAVLIQFARLFPAADWYTSVWDQKRTPFTKGWKIHTSWISRIPFFRTHHEWIPFFMPFIFEAFDFSGYDLVISIGSAEAKGVITRPGTCHLNYCLTPTRYLYSHAGEYLSNPLYRFVGKYLRKWDLIAATRPDQMIAISTQVKKRIKDVYKREVDIIYPSVDVEKFTRKSAFTPPYQDYYLTVSRLVAYKKIEILMKAFNTSGKTLVVVGEGAERQRLERLAKPNIHFVGFVAERELLGYYEHCQAFVQANEEDFGIAMVEAQAAGKPVIAYAQGGASDIVEDGKTGILVKDQTPQAFVQAIDTFETMSCDARDCQRSAERFSISIWEKSIKERIQKICH